MRYKFRGKEIKTKQWVYGSLIIPNDVVYCIRNRYLGEYEVIPETVGQFTGLYDKNGKEIYEGDIVQERGLRETWALSRRDEFSERKHVITWCDYDLQWCGKLIEDDEDYELDTRNLSFLERKYTLEVIGNVHDKGEVK